MNNQPNSFKGKIAIATDDQKRVTGHIGRCRAFMIYEIDSGKVISKELRENQFTNHRMRGAHHHHGDGEAHKGQGHGRHTHEHLINGLKDCSYLVSSGGGWRVVEDLKQHNISTLFTDIEMIDEALDKFIKKEGVIYACGTCLTARKHQGSDICPLSTNNMRLVQDELKKQKIDNVEFVSLSFDPEVDKPSVLKKFGEIRNLDFSNWTFLTGDKESIKRILKLTNIVAAPSDSSELNGQMIYYYIHTDRISVMDKDGIIRKDHLGSSVNIDELINDIKKIGD